MTGSADANGGDTFADQRAANGHAAPYNVPVWEVGNEEQNPAGADVENQYQNQYYTQQFLGAAPQYGRSAARSTGLDSARRAVIARKLADSYAKLNMLNEAGFCYRIALLLDPTDAGSKTQLDSILAQLERQRVNRLRQPAISENLDQDHAVRPRLAPSAAAQGGGQ